jgi:hypothetical protein
MEPINFFDFPFLVQSGISTVVSFRGSDTRARNIWGNQMTNPSRWRKPQDRMTRRYDLNQVLDILLAFDQSVVECSMRLYNVPRRDRVAMREQNRRLHHALRECLPRLLEPKPTFLPKAVRA